METDHAPPLPSPPPSKEFCPWVEKHRPKHFDHIVMDPLNRTILSNVLRMRYFPHLLLYGPPGTGKTTTVINLIQAYEPTHHRELMIHLNASDERGIDIIRNQISQFVNAKTLFHTGMKFVVLDEVDYMTKNAQQALRYLLQNNQNPNVRFCLMCNYISKIDEGLQNEFLKLRFHQLPESDMLRFLRKVCREENMTLTEHTLRGIIRFFQSDIRSMLNFLQSNQDHTKSSLLIPNALLWEKLLRMLQKRDPETSVATLQACLHKTSTKYNIDKKNIIKEFLHYILRHRPEFVTSEFLSFVESCLHEQEMSTKIWTQHFFSGVKSFFTLDGSDSSHGSLLPPSGEAHV